MCLVHDSLNVGCKYLIVDWKALAFVRLTIWFLVLLVLQVYYTIKVLIPKNEYNMCTLILVTNIE